MIEKNTVDLLSKGMGWHRLLCIWLVLLLVWNTAMSQKLPYAPFARTAQFVGAAISEKDWYNWCVSPIQGKDGKIHIFSSRWPASEGMDGWYGDNAEIAHFVGDRPEGPFTYVSKVVTTAMFPDRKTMAGPHNPRVSEVDGKYILMYICQNPSARGKQRVGMMIADRLEGPWRFAGKHGGIMVDPSANPKHWTYNAAIGADNPTFLKIGKKYYIYYKCGTPNHMDAKYGYAVSNKLEGPYTLCDSPITDNVSYIEDAHAYHYKDNYYLLTTDNLGGNTGIYGALILWQSKTGLDFKLTDAQIAMGTIFDYWGTPKDKSELERKYPKRFIRDPSGKLERPAILLIDGKPAYLYAVADVNIHGGEVSESYVFKIDPDTPQQTYSLWYKQPAADWMKSALPIGNGRIGAMIFGGVEQEHIQFNDKTLWAGSSTQRGNYHNFGDIFIDFNHAAPTGYIRRLNLSEALAEVSYKSDRVTYRREYLASNPDNVIAMRFTADRKGMISFRLRLDDAHKGQMTVKNNEITIGGKLDLLLYSATLSVLLEKGTLTTDDKTITVNNADAVTLILSAGTDYDPQSPTYLTDKDWRNNLNQTLQYSVNKGYANIRKDHISDYRSLFDRVMLNVGDATPTVPTDELIKSYTKGQYNPALDVLFFQYGRYLAISSSRAGLDLPSNLQGLWNNSLNPPWGSDIHSNINIQMNYWLAEPANLPECHEPFINYIYNEAMLLKSWRNMAAELNCRGWAMKTQNNIFGYSDFTWNRPANGWYCMHIWDKYLFNPDRDYLEKKAYPVMKTACQFWLDRLIVDDDGSLVAPHEWSPEHGPSESGIAYAQQIIADLFANTIEAGKILGNDGDFVGELENTYKRLDKGLKIGDKGLLREWKYTNDDMNDKHRHVSHLMALHPAKAVSPMLNPEYAEAARKSLDARGDGGTGWSRVWKIAFWARLLDGNRAHKLLMSALELSDESGTDYMNAGGVYENLFDSHPPFQIDGNLGATACMTEMLLQSHLKELHLLPALPDAWSRGEIRGLRARGAFNVNIRWADHRLTSAEINSRQGGECRIRTSVPVSVKGANIRSEKDDKGYYVTVIPTLQGKTYQLTAD
jgi:alpha-L-fucosidase 2